ncbi:MAG TPA: hydrolase TatD [Candidatus Omnitrophica bacterium]|nr:hydrolase TatD [Candidatus Omnitrophota bacterium]
MLIDTHCHLDFPDFDHDRELVLKNAFSAGVGAMINVASSLEGSRRAIGLANACPGVYASVGIHPHDAKDCPVGAWPEIKCLAGREKVVAIGEVGLDFYRNISEPAKQAEIFKKFIGLAQETKLPLIVHSRLAQDQTLEILKDHPGLSSTGVVIHCFSGDIDFLKECLYRGYFVSFTCNVTYKKADAIRQVLGYVPLDRMFLETDAPYLSPEGKRGKRNEPANIVELAHAVAKIKQVDFDKVCEQTTRNAKLFFKIG